MNTISSYYDICWEDGVGMSVPRSSGGVSHPTAQEWGTWPALFSIPVGSGARRYKIGAIAVPHLIEQPCLKAEGVPVLAREFQVNDFPNIQISIGLETDAGFADVGAGPILRNLIQQTLAADPHGHVDQYAVSPAPLERKRSGCQRRKVLRDRVPHSEIIGKISGSL